MESGFERLEEWQKSRALVCAIYGVTARGGFHRDPGLRDRLRGDVVSVMSAIAVACEDGGGRGEQPVADAARTCTRLRSTLVVACDQGYVSEVELQALSGQTRDLGDALRALALQPPMSSRDRARSGLGAASSGWR